MKRNIFVTKTMEIIYIIIYTVIGKGFSYRIFFELRKLIEKIVTYFWYVPVCLDQTHLRPLYLI